MMSERKMRGEREAKGAKSRWGLYSWLIQFWGGEDPAVFIIILCVHLWHVWWTCRPILGDEQVLVTLDGEYEFVCIHSCFHLFKNKVYRESPLFTKQELEHASHFTCPLTFPYLVVLWDFRHICSSSLWYHEWQEQCSEAKHLLSMKKGPDSVFDTSS